MNTEIGRAQLLPRVGHVLLTYVTRPLLWAVGAIYLFALVAMLWSTYQSRLNSPRSPGYPEIAVLGRTLIIGDPQALRDIEQGKFDTSVATIHVTWPEFSADHLRRLRTCRHLRALRFERAGLNEISDEEFSVLGDLQQLEMLSLAGCRLSPSAQMHLGRLPNLRYLELSGCRLQGDYSGLESLARLETLILGSPAAGDATAEDAPLLPELKRLPRLKTLVLWSLSRTPAARTPQVPAPHQPAITPVDDLANLIRDLQGIKTLRFLFVNEFTANFPGFDALQRDLTNIRVRPSFVDLNRVVALMGVVFLASILMFLLAAQIHSQFSQAAARLIPNYTTPHLVPVVAIWIIGSALHTIPFLLRDVPLLAASGLSLLPWAIMSGIALVATPTGINSRRSRWLTTPLVVICIAWFPLATVMLQWNKSTIDWYLRGHEQGWAWLFMTLGVALPAALLRQSLDSNCIFAERGIHSPPISFAPAAMNAWKQEVYWKQLPGRGWFSRWVGGRLERAIRAAGSPGWRPRCNLWIVGNYNNGAMAPLMAISMALTIACILWALPGNSFSVRDALTLQSPLVLFFSTFLPDFPMVLIVGVWRGRRPLFATESLRAVSRLQFARQIAAALAWDLLPVGGIYLVVLAWYTMSADPDRWTVGWTLAMLLYFMARWLVIYGLALWSIVIRRDWVLVLTAVITGYASLFANLLIVFLQAPMFGVKPLPSDMPDVGVLALTGCALLLGIAGSVIARLAYWRWQRIELA